MDAHTYHPRLRCLINEFTTVVATHTRPVMSVTFESSSGDKSKEKHHFIIQHRKESRTKSQRVDQLHQPVPENRLAENEASEIRVEGE